MKHMTYVGPAAGWNVEPGDTALVCESNKPGTALAQFDDFSKQREGNDLAFGWHEFPADRFKEVLT